MTTQAAEKSSANTGSFFQKEIGIFRALVILLVLMAVTSTVMYAIGQKYFWRTQARTPQERGLNYFMALTQKEPDKPEHWVDLGWYHYQAGDYTQALDSHLRALEINPSHAGGLFNAGITLIQMSDHASAAEYLQMATQVNPDYWEGYFALGVAYVGLEEWELAQAALVDAADIYGASPEVWFYLGHVAENLNEFEDAAYYYEQVLRFISDFAPALEALERISNFS
ncbi:MAG: tetratricopeptide repeat protein [Dethiobacter sp.]|jgi:tetratricopeptide (TPR) repeat protein|nr:tetratricopeptide repeat protein [Dethiobacter sp.]